MLDALRQRDDGDHGNGPSQRPTGDTDDRAGGEALAGRGRLWPQDIREILEGELAKAEAREARSLEGLLAVRCAPQRRLHVPVPSREVDRG